MNKKLWAPYALTADGWQQDVLVSIDTQGVITAVVAGTKPEGERAGVLLPAMANLHSHAFQRAMAGMTETRGVGGRDSFWTWRSLMYRFLESLNPDDVQAITAFAQMEMLESGYASVGEFHYLHHQPNGNSYDNCAEMSERIVAASLQTGIGLTLLPVLYEQGGCDGKPLSDHQQRFANTIDSYSRLHSAAAACIERYHKSANVGMAPHSLRAVGIKSLNDLLELAGGAPIHIHVAEQQAEVDEVQHIYGARPVQWLLDNMAVSDRWCLIHATWMNDEETRAVARAGAVVGLCPITESNLGDGIFNGDEFKQNQGMFGIGTDSNIRISMSEELRTLEYSQRLTLNKRAIFAESSQSTGRVLYEKALYGGAIALQRPTGKIAAGHHADLLSLDMDSVHMAAATGDGWLDAWLFAADDQLITDVWARGEHIVVQGNHINRAEIEPDYRQVIRRLSALV